MNMVKYALVIAAAAFAGSAFAQTTVPAANAQPAVVSADQKDVAVSVVRKDGVINVNVKGEPKKLLTKLDTLEEMIGRAMLAVGPDTSVAKAIEAAMAGIKANLEDANAPVSQQIEISISINPNVDAGTMDAKVDTVIDGAKYASNTKSTFADDGSVSTTGTVVKTLPNGEVQTVSSNVASKTDGTLVVNGVATKSASAARADALTSPDTVSNEAASAAAGNNETIPDGTIVVSGKE